jgi:hypothetical protein
MIQFQNLKISKCPTCGCQTVVAESLDVDNYSHKAEPRIREHTMGGRWERRKFLCGFEVAWCPNFRRAEVKTVCPKDTEYQRLESAQQELADKERAIQEERRAASDAVYRYTKSKAL